MSEVVEESFPEPIGGHAAIITFREPPCLVLYAYVAAALALWALWALRRWIFGWYLRARSTPRPQRRAGAGVQEPLLRRRQEKPDPLQAWSQTITDEQGRAVTFEGYADHWMGSLVYSLVPATSLVVLVLFGVVLYDYYSGCEWVWPEQLCYIGNFPLFGSFDVNSYVFLVLWVFGLCWFGLLIWGSGGQMANLFRVQASLQAAKYIQVTVQEKSETLSSGYSRTLYAREALFRMFRRLLGLSGLPGGVFGLSRGPSQTVLKSFDSAVGLQFVEYRCVRYVLDPAAGGFTKYNPGEALQGGHATFLRILEEGGLRTGAPAAAGASMFTVDEMFRRAGPNRIPFEVDAMGTALLEEFATFFFLYQFGIYAVCLWFSYWHYTIIALTIAGISGVFEVVVRLGNQKAIKAVMEQSTTVTLKRDGKEVEVDIEEIVPGDIVKVRDDWLVPCDLLLLNGGAVCDESMLTGESMPVQRLAPTEQLPAQDPSQRLPAKHVLVAGTTVLQCSRDDCWAVATHTGVNTQKGQLLLLILYPPKLLFKYDEQLAVVFTLLILYAIVVMFVTMHMMYVLYAQDLPFTATWASAIFTCSCVLPTMLHIVLSVGQVVSAKRLKMNTYNIFCAAPKRIALGGKVRVVCFDKTGTLTENSLNFFGVHCIKACSEDSRVASLKDFDCPFERRVALLAGNISRGEGTCFEEEPRMEGWNLDVLCGLACAHSLSPFSGSEAGVVGNAVEVNMFKASGWRLDSEDASNVTGSWLGAGGPSQHQLQILRRFDFSHSTMTMSAVVQHLPSGRKGIYCKGSFEQVVQRCLKNTVPADFKAVAEAHALSGMYVLALATRALPSTCNAEAVSEMKREDIEQDLVMLGLLLFKNSLRHDTRATIESLRGGEVRSVMITGDASGTAIRIAKEAALVQPGVPVLLGDMVPQDEGAQGMGSISWICQDEDITAMNELLLGNTWLRWRREYKQWREGEGKGARGEATAGGHRKRGSPGVERTITWPRVQADEEPQDGAGEDPGARGQYSFSMEELVLSRLFEWCELAVTQRAHEWLQETPCSPDLRRVLLGSRQATLKKGKALSSGLGESSLAWELLTSIRIFARMTPSGKVSVVEGLMSQGLICAMVGDGGNDSGALRTAHVGLALSNATSATVVAPFTTNRLSVAPVVDLLREGRAALATSFAGYKYCVHYGLLNSFFKFLIFLYGIGQSMSSRYLQDLVGFLSFSWAMSQAMPAPELVEDRPTSSLFSLFTVSSIMGIWILNMAFMAMGLVLVTSHEDFVPFPVHLVRVTEWWKLSRNWETSTVFFLYTFQQFWSAVVFSFGYPHRLPWYKNLLLLTLSVTGFGFLCFLLLSEANSFTRTFHLVYERVEDHPPWSWAHSCPPMPRELRVRLFGVILANLLLVTAFEKAIVQGPFARFLRDKWRRLSKHITLRL